ncbi:MAG: amidohydrolase [Erysipelotrichaceae bacterium]|nr:amidohydrolase [Erysipelotrichaceae bacterium]
MDNKELSLYLKETRRHLHQIPEIGFDCFITSAYLQKELRSFGYEPIIMAKTGVIAVKPGKNKDAIAFRSDMDALNVLEQTQVDYESLTKGQMHACGHDGHMAILLAFAKSVAHLEPFNHSLVFVFQPAEEGPGGARVMVEEGLIERFNITKIFGLHVFPGLNEGIIGLAKGPMMAQSMEIDIHIQGKSAHAAEPHEGTDALICAAQLILAAQSIVSRNVDPLETAVITFGTIKGGEAPNIIPQEVIMTGTARAFNPQVMSLIHQRLEAIFSGLSISTGCQIKASLIDTYPPVLNDEALYDRLSENLTCKTQVIKPKMFAEDFSYYQQKVPGLFAFVGTRNELKNYIYPVHSCFFNFDEEALMSGVEFYTQVLHIFD